MCDYLIRVFLLREITNSMRMGWLFRGFFEATQAPRCLKPLCYFLHSGWVWARLGVGVGVGGRGRECPQQETLSVSSSSPDESDRQQPERTVPRGGPRRGCTLQSPKFPGSPTGPQLPLSRGQEQLASCGGVPLPCSGQQPRCACLHSRVPALREPCWAS